MTTMSILLYVFINQKTCGGEEHTDVRCSSYTTIWQDILLIINAHIFFNPCPPSIFFLSFICTHTVSQLT